VHARQPINERGHHAEHRRWGLFVCSLLTQLGAVLAMLAWPIALAAGDSQELDLIWKRGSDFVGPPAPLAADLDLDRRLEIIQVKQGEVAAFDPENGKAIWSQALDENEILLTPVAGHFLGDGRINLIVPARSGRLFILDGPSGQRLQNDLLNGPTGQPLQDDLDCGFPLSQAPVAFALHSDDPQDTREGILLYDDSRKILFGYRVRLGELHEVLRCPTPGGLPSPPAVGKTGYQVPGASDAAHIAFVTREGKLFVIAQKGVEADAAQTELTNGYESNRKFELGVTLGDLDGDGLQELIVADTLGWLHARRAEGRELKAVWAKEKIRIPNPPRSCPVAIDVDHDGCDEILVYSGGKELKLINGKTGDWFWPNEVYRNREPIYSPQAVFRAADRTAYAVFCDRYGLKILNLSIKTIHGGFDNVQQGRLTPIVAPLTGGQRAEVFIRSSIDGRGYLVDSGLDWHDASPMWLGLRGGATRASSADPVYEAFRRRQHKNLSDRMEDKLKHARDRADEGEWDVALTTVRQVLETSPHHNDARRLARKYFIRDNLFGLLVVAVLSTALAIYLGWMAYRNGRAALDHWLSRRALRNDNPERAIKLLYRLCLAFPKRKKYVSELGKVYIKQKQFDSQSALIFECARQFFPDENRYLMALATAYSSGPKFDEPAAIVYNAMAQIAKKPGAWFFILGQALRGIGRPQEALEAFRQTIVHQFDDPKLPEYMTELYMELGITAPEVLPTLDRVFDQFKDDRSFLKTYCLASQFSRRYDDKAQQVAAMLLELDPAAPAAHVIMATRHLQGGENKDAMMHSQKILQVNPNDSIGLRLLGACYAAENRLDETAMEIFAKALEANPDTPEIITAVSHGYIQQDRQDTDAKEVYKKVLVHNPNDETVLGQLAKIASGESDDDLTIRAIEPLLALGKRTRELVLQLANAYCRLGIVEDKAEPIYREALLHQPNHATIQENLAAIYLRKRKCDGDAAHVFELVFERHTERFDMGLQLMRCYQSVDMPEKALTLGQGLQEAHSDNSELQKLIASASAMADQMESAIEGYEQVLATNPDDHEAISALSSLYFRKRRYDNHAIEIYNRAIQNQPDQHEPYLAAAQSYASRGSWDHSIQTFKHMMTRVPGKIGAAISQMEELVEASPKEHKLRWYLIDTMIFDGRLREARQHLQEVQRIDGSQGPRALEAFDKILEKNPRDAMAHLERGRLQQTLGHDREARQSMEQAHRFYPENEEIIRSLLKLYQHILEKRDSAEVRAQLGRLAMKVDRHDLAISCFQQTSRDYRWEGESIRNLSRCFMAKGMLDLALQELKRLPIENDVKDLLYELGARYEAVNDVPGAREVYKLIFSNDITYKDVKGKLERLSEAGVDQGSAERTAILDSLSEKAKQRYELIEELGRGAMGIVYRARDNELEEEVALKILPDNLLRNQEALRRFRQEARNARKLSHPNIVRIHDIGEERGRKYISMEFVRGSDLKQKLRKHNRKLPFETTIRYSLEICKAMSYAHSIGIVHRDIKPANLMLTIEDDLKVTDFGIAKMVESTASPEATMAGAIVGTPLYMSPEQVKGEQVDHRADIYSMGIVFYELASGRPPFTEGDLAYQHLFVEPKPLTGVPEDYGQVIMKCLAKEKEQRWQSADEIRDALKKVNVNGE